MRLGLLIKQTRINRRITLRKLESLSGVPRNTISRIESGEVTRPRPDILTALAKALEIPLADLYALTSYWTPHDLPAFAPYLRARYSDLSPNSMAELTVYFQELARRDGVRLDGPQHREDESK